MRTGQRIKNRRNVLETVKNVNSWEWNFVELHTKMIDYKSGKRLIDKIHEEVCTIQEKKWQQGEMQWMKKEEKNMKVSPGNK